MILEIEIGSIKTQNNNILCYTITYLMSKSQAIFLQFLQRLDRLLLELRKVLIVNINSKSVNGAPFYEWLMIHILFETPW